MEQPFRGQNLTESTSNTRTVTNNNDRPRRSNGSFESEYQPQDFIAAIETLDTPTLTNIAEHLNCGKGTAHRYLAQLESNGDVTNKEIGNVLLWRKTH